jgi:hypothetical protein
MGDVDSSTNVRILESQTRFRENAPMLYILFRLQDQLQAPAPAYTLR